MQGHVGLRGACGAAPAPPPLPPEGSAGPAGCDPSTAFVAPAAAPRLFGEASDLQSRAKEGWGLDAGVKAGPAGGGAWSRSRPQPAAPPGRADRSCRSTASQAPEARSPLSRRGMPGARLLQRWGTDGTGRGRSVRSSGRPGFWRLARTIVWPKQLPPPPHAKLVTRQEKQLPTEMREAWYLEGLGFRKDE